MGWKNTEIQSRIRIIKSAICNLSWFRMFIKKEQSCQNNPEKSYTEKNAIHEPSGWAMFTRCKQRELFQRERLQWKLYWASNENN